MITKRNGNGQTECVGCKEKDKFALSWDCFLYNFNNKPYCFECLMEKLEDYQQRIDKTIEHCEKQKKKMYKSRNKIAMFILLDLLKILKGEDK